MNIESSRIYFLILIPITLIFMYFTFRKYRNGVKKDYFTIISRVLVFVLLIIALSDITLSIKGKNTSTIFLLDMSESMGDNKEDAEAFVDNALNDMPKNNTAGVIVFGDNAVVDKIVDKKNQYKGIKEKPITTATNIEEAIQSSLTLFPKGAAKRIVLVSDGEENQGEILKTVPLIKEKNIDFKVFKIEKKTGNEVYVDGVKVPDNIAIGEEFSIVIKVESNYQTEANLVLFSGRERKGEQRVQLQKGTNTFVFKDVQGTGGFKGYRVLIEAKGDTNMANNEMSCYTNVISKPKILLIEGRAGDGAGVLAALKASNSDINVIKANASPRSLNEFLEYKSIVLCNVHADDLSKGFMDNVESYVKDYGGGVVTFGGEDSYALGGYKGTNLEKVLPVDMDKKGENEIPQISLTLIIDHSGSMSGGEGSTSKMTLAKEAAMKSIENLRNSDEVAVLAFDDSFQWVVKPQKVEDREAIKNSIAGINVQGGTSIYPALEEGIKKQKESGAKIKHTILLTDGQDNFSFTEYDELLKDMRANNITLSTVSVGQDANDTLMKALGEKGNGRSYHTDIYTDIPRIFAKEVFLSTGVYIINEEFTPKLVTSHEILSNVLTENKFPSVLGYIGTSMKDKAIEILRTDKDEPLLATYQYGLGKTASWTSDINGEWSKNLLTWEKASQFIKNIVYYTIPSYNGNGKVSIYQKGSEAIVDFYSDSVKSGATIKGKYNSEGGDTGEIELTQKEPGLYTARVPLKELGFYNFNIREELDGEVVNSYLGAFAMQYSEEFKFNKNAINIDAFIKEVDGRFINKSNEVFEGEAKEAYKTVDLTVVSLIIALFLFLIDVAYRRLNLDIGKYISRFRVGRKVADNKIEKASIEKNDNGNSKSVVKEMLINDEKEAEKQAIKSVKSKSKKVKGNSPKEKLDTNSLLKKKQDRNS